jgi:Ca2+-binding RTX toxin-like protein
MIKMLAASAAAAVMGLTMVGTTTAAHADPCDHDGHGQPPFCPQPPPPVPVPTGFNIILGTSHSDRLPGTSGRDAIFGFGGHRDVLIGRAGRDRLYGMRGHDVLRAVDGERDVVAGGRGRDRCVVDAIDVVRGCETIIVR